MRWRSWLHDCDGAVGRPAQNVSDHVGRGKLGRPRKLSGGRRLTTARTAAEIFPDKRPRVICRPRLPDTLHYNVSCFVNHAFSPRYSHLAPRARVDALHYNIFYRSSKPRPAPQVLGLAEGNVTTATQMFPNERPRVICCPRLPDTLRCNAIPPCKPRLLPGCSAPSSRRYMSDALHCNVLSLHQAARSEVNIDLRERVLHPAARSVAELPPVDGRPVLGSVAYRLRNRVAVARYGVSRTLFAG